MLKLDAQGLIGAGRELSEPFELSVLLSDGTPSPLTVVKILRLLPGKRVVAVAKMDGQVVLIKVFVGIGAADDA